MLESEIRPLQPGAEIGIPSGPKGTLGLIVKNATGDRFGISCSHVIARCGQAEPDTLVIQPANPYVDPTLIAIGKLTRPFSTLTFGPPPNADDLAVVKLDAALVCQPGYVQGGQVARHAFDGTVADMANLGTMLNGAITKGQPGKVFLSQARQYSLTYHGFGTVTFEGIVKYRTSCQEGDSGSAVMLDNSDIVLGIHIGGEAGDVGYFVPVASFLQRNGLSLFTG